MVAHALTEEINRAVALRQREQYAKYKPAKGQKELQWITIGGTPDGDKKHAGGTPVQITKTGQIVKGPKELTGHKVDELGKGTREKNEAKANAEHKAETAKRKANEAKASEGKSSGNPGESTERAEAIQPAAADGSEGKPTEVSGSGAESQSPSDKPKKDVSSNSGPASFDALGIAATKEGRRVWLSGKTFDHKDTIRAAGGKWDSDSKRWWIGSGKWSDLESKLQAKNDKLAKFAPAEQKATPATDSPNAPKPAPASKITIGGNTFAHKDKIRAAGGKWDGARKVWMIDSAAADKLRNLPGLTFSDDVARQKAAQAEKLAASQAEFDAVKQSHPHQSPMFANGSDTEFAKPLIEKHGGKNFPERRQSRFPTIEQRDAFEAEARATVAEAQASKAAKAQEKIAAVVQQHGRMPRGNGKALSFTTHAGHGRRVQVEANYRQREIGEIVHRNDGPWIVVESGKPYFVSDDYIEDMDAWSDFKQGAGWYAQYKAVPVEPNEQDAAIAKEKETAKARAAAAEDIRRTARYMQAMSADGQVNPDSYDKAMANLKRLEAGEDAVEILGGGESYRSRYSLQSMLRDAFRKDRYAKRSMRGQKDLISGEVRSPDRTQKKLRWITLKNDDGGGGTHVQIDGKGQIQKGPAALTGHKVGELGAAKRRENEAKVNEPETKAQTTSEKQDPAQKSFDDLPNSVQTHVKIHVTQLNRIAKALKQGKATDDQFQGGGRYAADAWKNQGGEGIVSAAKAFREKFEGLAAKNGIDAAAVLKEAGWPDEMPGLDQSAKEWAEPKAARDETPRNSPKLDKPQPGEPKAAPTQAAQAPEKAAQASEPKQLDDLMAKRKEISDRHIWDNAMSKGNSRPAPPDASELDSQIRDAKEREGKALWQRTQSQVASVMGMPPAKHKAMVKAAIESGKSVPPDVLADYPELKPPAPKPSAPAPFKPVPVPGAQMGLFGQTQSGQKQLFNVAKPKKKDPKPVTTQASLLEQIEDTLAKKQAESAPLKGQREMFARRRTVIGDRPQVDRYSVAWDESQHPRDDGGKFAMSESDEIDDDEEIDDDDDETFVAGDIYELVGANPAEGWDAHVPNIWYRVQPKSMGLDHRSETSNDELAEGVHVHKTLAQSVTQDGTFQFLGGRHEIVVIRGPERLRDTGDVEGWVLPIGKGEIVGRFDFDSLHSEYESWKNDDWDWGTGGDDASFLEGQGSQTEKYEASPTRRRERIGDKPKQQPESQVTVPKKRSAPERQPGDGSAGWQRVGGAPVFVNGDGKIIKGCPGLKGEHVADLIDPDGDDTPAQVWEFIREGKQSAESASSESVAGRAAERLASLRKSVAAEINDALSFGFGGDVPDDDSF